MEKKIFVCDVISSVNEYTGGPALSLIREVINLNQSGKVDCTIFTFDYKKLGKLPKIDRDLKIITIPASKIAVGFKGFSHYFEHLLIESTKNNTDLINNHGLWMFPNFYARKAAKINKLPLIISTHGMLEEWSLNRSWLKKKIIWNLWEFENLKSAVAFKVTSKSEALSIRRLGFKQPIAIIPYCLETTKFLRQDCERKVLEDDFPKLRNKKWALFMSRIDPKKGLMELVEAWKELSSEFADWHLVIAGPDLIGYGNKVKFLVKKLSLENSITFTGMLSGNVKECAFINSEFLVLPTHSENFGMVINESLSRSLPVITTKEAPWPEIEIYNCGWWIEDNEFALKDALIKAMSNSTLELKEMGVRGRKLIEDKYNPIYLTQSYIDLLSWVVNGGKPPQFCLE